MTTTYPLINGRRYDFSSAEIRVNGDIILGIKEMNYTDSLEGGEVRGTHPQKLGRTTGELKSEASMTMFRQEADAFEQKLGDGFATKVFDIVVQYNDDGQPNITDRVIGCRIKKKESTNTAGTDPLAIKYDLDPMYILHNDRGMIPNLIRG